jgi:enolase
LINANLDITNQKVVDDFLIALDGTPNKGELRLGSVGFFILLLRRFVSNKKTPPLFHRTFTNL